MQLKDYQIKVIDQLKAYLTDLDKAFSDYMQVFNINPDLAKSVDYTKTAWDNTVSNRTHKPVINGLGKYTPSTCLKVPTGGGKTLLACHAIDHIQTTFKKRQTGVVLWIVPSTQIYRQTLKALQDRNNPYRQTLDRISAGKTMIVQKSDRLTKQDAEERLVVVLLMLQSSNRENKETLKMFQMNGGYTGFFPAEDQYDLHKQLLKAYPNLDTIGSSEDMFGELVTYSFGNMLRITEPLIIIDEGHKAYSQKARDTINNLNPSFILELSATPPHESNVLIEITGRELEQADMIKLPIRIYNKPTQDWKLVVQEAKLTRDALEENATELFQKNGTYIRPIQLIQVERTGKDQRGQGYIHAEDIKEFLIQESNVPEHHIAIKSSEKDDIEGIDLLNESCEIRYIITKSALQEGWDCSFAYVLTVLAGGKSTTAMTQLIGRVLRQPFGQKTHIPDLNECYVYTYRQTTSELVHAIKNGLESEGLGDIMKNVMITDNEPYISPTKERMVEMQDKFKEYEGKIVLPKFVIKLEKGSDDVQYHRDIISRIDWDQLDLSFVDDIPLSKSIAKENIVSVSFGSTIGEEFLEARSDTSSSLSTQAHLDIVFMARQLLSIVANPWRAYDISLQVINTFRSKHTDDIIAGNFMYIIEEVKMGLAKQIDIQCESIFKALLNEDKIRFVLIQGTSGYRIPKRIKTSGRPLLSMNNSQNVQSSLFDAIGEDDFNELERTVALYLDSQEKLLWWYRNGVGANGYYIKGWKDKKIYPDFIIQQKSETAHNGKVFVLETKGLHLKNEDTEYKQNIFELCNTKGIQTDWNTIIDKEFDGKEIEFQVLFEDDWRRITTNILEK